MRSSAAGGSPQRASSGALVLLRKLLATGWFDSTAVARALVVTDEALELYLSDSLAIPLDRQLCLALFVIECVPPLARPAHRLRAQVSAAMAYDARQMERHKPPMPRTRW